MITTASFRLYSHVVFFRESNEEVIGHIYNASKVPGKLLHETKGKGKVVFYFFGIAAIVL